MLNKLLYVISFVFSFFKVIKACGTTNFHLKIIVIKWYLFKKSLPNFLLWVKKFLFCSFFNGYTAISVCSWNIENLGKSKSDTEIDFMAKQTPGFSGADIANICNEAALIAARSNKKVVQRQDFLDAVDRIIAGLEKKNKIITPQEKRVIAFHEAGHATVSWMLEHASPLVKVTIVPRGKSLGAAWYLPEERQITTVDQIMDEMCAALGGRAAEEIVFGRVSTGALSDLEKITKQAYASIVYYGLNEKIGNISYYDSSGQSEYSFSKPYSETTARTIDEEVKKMTDVAYAKTKRILLNNKEKLTTLAEKLLEKEVIFKEDLEDIFGKRPFDKPEEPEVKKIETPQVNPPELNS